MQDEVFPDTAEVSHDGHLMLGGCDVVELARDFGTPLIIYDRATIEARASSYAAVLGSDHVFYASKAFCCVAICELIETLGMGIDVCSGGELRTALTAGFPPPRIIFHGNNKSVDELRYASEVNVGRIAVDSLDEIDRLSKIPGESRLLLRVTPGVEAHTHEFVQTGQEDSKFGFSLADGVALEAIGRARELDGYRLVGLHAHIGSQIFELAAVELAAKRLASLAAKAGDEFGLETRELNLGGGLGIAHTVDEMTPDPTAATTHLREVAGAVFRDAGLDAPEVFVEPGRSLVGASGVTVYEVGTVKHIPGVRTYVSVDGGMSDNIRPALYGARYEAKLANRMEAAAGPLMAVAGKHCESGDVLIKEAHLPSDVGPGDLLCIPATGAYTYSMANNYNRVPRPAAVLVANGDATAIVARETASDLLRYDRRLDGTPASN
ncbi:MAG: diaminopimelate decarboxylase [Actinomycetota bacterium]|nr:diaminopimelate decarboxylase [Actinomycetota bacterium]